MVFTEKDVREISLKTKVPEWMVWEMTKLDDEKLEAMVRACDDYKTYTKMRIGESLILKLLNQESGYSLLELKKLIVKFGDVGSLAEFVLENPKIKSVDDFF